LDSFLTKNAISDGVGSELNIFVSTDSVISIFFSPVPFIISVVMVLLLAFHYKFRMYIPDILREERRGYYLVALPYYYILGMGVVLINNVSVSLGMGSMIGNFIDFSGGHFGTNRWVRWIGLCLFFSVSFSVLHPVVKILLKYVYSKERLDGG
ncbi:MAG TPA: hypothetical protein VIC08_09425, partial [Cellvibrionaceae bacterium]